MDLSTGRVTLVEEARELLVGMETALLDIEKHGCSDEHINAIFRAAHTIKGASGLFGLTLIEKFTQRLENVLDLARAGACAMDADLMALLLRCGDYIAQLVDAIEAHREHDDPAPAVRAELLDALSRFEKPRKASAPIARAPAPPPKPTWDVSHVSMRYAPRTMVQGTCPLSHLDHLATLGEVVYVHTATDALPPEGDFDPTMLYLGFEVGYRGKASGEDLERAFAIVADQVTLRTLSPWSPVDQFVEHLRALPSSAEALQCAWIEHELLSERMLQDALAGAEGTERAETSDAASAADEGPAPLGDPEGHAPVAEVRAAPVPAPAAPAATADGARARPADDKRVAEQRNVKVDAGRLDDLINLVGELVIAAEGARTSAAAPSVPRGEVLEGMSRVLQIVESIRDRALSMRMTPIGDVFQRFPRVVRDVSRELGKQIELDVSGADAELDKSIVERLADPMLHIVRNAIDHGIEPVAEREAAGKPPVGHLRLHAHHESGCIVVEVGDDGRGLDPERLRRKAIEKGLIDPADSLTPQECFKLIFAPGFSTAQTVTNLSGRGVGMDVVKRNVEALRGDIEIQSEVGFGSTFRLRLPLTLAMIDGFQVVVAGTTFVIPLELVVECVDMNEAETEQHLVNLRDEPLPYLRLRDVFELAGERGPRESLVVVRFGQRRIGLVVDALLGNSQAVIKPLGPIFRGLPAVSSSTILGDGTVALILDVPALIDAATTKVSARATSALTAPRAQHEGSHP